MKMPYITRGPVGSRLDTGICPHRIDHVAIKDGQSSSKFVTSWSACLDDQVGLEGPKGGVLLQAFISALGKKADPTHRQLLMGLSEELYEVAKLAKPYFHEHGWPLVCPKPVLGSLHKPEDILDTPFSFERVSQENTQSIASDHTIEQEDIIGIPVSV